MLADREGNVKGQVIDISNLHSDGLSVECSTTIRPLERVDLLDKVTRLIFTDDELSTIESNMRWEFNPKMGKLGRGKNKKELRAKCNLFSSKGRKSDIKLTPEHMEVHNALITHWLAGNATVTLKMLEYALKGKECRKIRASRRERLREIILDLMSTIVCIDATEEFQARGYGENFKQLNNLIKGSYSIATIKGQEVECVHIEKEPILLLYAEAKKQIARYPITALAMPVPARDSQMMTVLLPYLARRVVSKELSHTILYKTIYDYVAQLKPLGKSIKTEKARIRTTVRAAFEYFKTLKLIQGWEERKARQEIDALIFAL